MSRIDFNSALPRVVGAKSCLDCQDKRIALYNLEEENSGLRRLIVELIEKNQRLRELLSARSIA